ncbi:MAG: NAD(P)-dependent malic enzyme [Bacillota bacterium]
MSKFEEQSLNLHKANTGKLDIIPNIKLKTREDLSLAYTPGVSYPCLEIKKAKDNAYKYTTKGKTVAIITDGSAVLGLGNIGPEASIPVMEGKSALLYNFSGIQAVPLALATQNPEEIIKTAKIISPNYSAIMLEDISAPNCVEIERRLQKELDIPVFHDDQHGTAIVVTAALLNSLKLVNKKINEIKVVVSGLGAAGSAIIKLLNKLGVKEIYGYDVLGIVKKTKYSKYNAVVKELIDKDYLIMAKDEKDLADLVKDKDVFIGVSAKDILKFKMVKSMNKDSIIFAMANPDPEIEPALAKKAGARIVGTGRSDYPNQINNVLVFPGLMKAVIDNRIKNINDDIKITTAKAIASLVSDDELNDEFILPDIFNKKVVKNIVEAIKKKA